MKYSSKYTRQFFPAPEGEFQWLRKTYIDHPPVWCSVDLRDGNQALVTPMNLKDKLTFFQMLVQAGFREIEIGFPAASETEYAFCRTLIEEHLIPEDVTIQVLTQSREHIIARTFEAIQGAPHAIVHLYNSTSVAQRTQVFHKDKPEIIALAVEGAKLCKEYRDKCSGDIRLEYSPESFTGTEMDFALEICNAVLDVWQQDCNQPVIINLPDTVSCAMPHVYANQVAYLSRHLHNRERVILSVHPHNDRGCAVAESELALLAGADRVEGTLFGNGERTGNADIVTIALNMYAQGVDPGLDFHDLPEMTRIYEHATGMHINERQPYSGSLVFAAFSGSHQDAIAKGMKWRESHPDSTWNVPYLPIDPLDIGRTYDGDVIRINSQSGKGGIGYLLEHYYGIKLPDGMREGFGYHVKSISDRAHKELLPEEVYRIFQDTYVNLSSPIALPAIHYAQKDGIDAIVTIQSGTGIETVTASGNGRLDAVSNAVRNALNLDYTLKSYTEHALEVSSKSKAVSYVSLQDRKGQLFWGVGIHTDIIVSSTNALLSAVNRMILKTV